MTGAINADKKPHIYRVKGKWYCRQRYSDRRGIRTSLGAARITPIDAFVAWCDWHKGVAYTEKWEHLKKCSDTVKSKS